MEKLNFRFRFLIAAFIAVGGLASCEKIIDITIPDKERKMVINGLISPEKPVRVNISKSLSILDYDSIIAIPGGNVQLFHGSDLIGKLQEEAGGFYSLPGFTPEVGQSYRLTATVNGMQGVEAEAVLPPLVPFLAVDTATFTTQWGSQELRVNVKFQDPSGTRNIYGFGVDVTTREYDYSTMTFTGRTVTRSSYLYTDSEGPVKDEFHNFEGKLYCDDLLFNGLTKSVEFGVSDYAFFESDTIWLTVKMEQVDPSYYMYAISNEEYQNAHGNPFSEPVQVFTNVKGGYGIFAGISVVNFPLTITGLRKY